ncbi:hypothetical protein F8388_014235 [Cannabis sativa]|uniref:Mitochondrial carrier protein n=1 Tax=Cannabis sativa TaxID=3483 RepID=A0A7J6GQA2_CANSA|nr:hypothetical protein F8388_014235 [Cannabis sativa]
MGRRKSQDVEHENKAVMFCSSGINIQQLSPDEKIYCTGGLFASVGQVGMGFGVSPSPLKPRNIILKLPNTNSYMKYVSVTKSGFQLSWVPELEAEKVLEFGEEKAKKNDRGGFKLRIKIENDTLRKLMSGGIAGAVSRTAVAPLETIKTHLMVGSCGFSAGEVFRSIMKTDGWQGLYRGNLVNVIRVTPNKAIELFAYDTVKKYLTPKSGEQKKILIPASLVAGARGVYKNSLHALSKIIREEGAAELYRGLLPSLIGVIPYAATNYFAYDTLRKAYKRAFNQEEIGNMSTLLMGSSAAAISSCATFPLEVARKQMQAGAFNGRQYKNLLHALLSIIEREGISGLYRGLGPSCMKLIPAAGISFMCYEACKRSMLEEKEEI